MFSLTLPEASWVKVSKFWNFTFEACLLSWEYYWLFSPKLQLVRSKEFDFASRYFHPLEADYSILVGLPPTGYDVQAAMKFLEQATMVSQHT